MLCDNTMCVSDNLVFRENYASIEIILGDIIVLMLNKKQREWVRGCEFPGILYRR
jgi:hypothetical protein